MNPKTKTLGYLPLITASMIAMIVYAAWTVAYLQLGRRPIPSMDDPMYIGGFSTAVSTAAYQAVQVLLLSWLVSIVVIAVIGCMPKAHERRWWWKRFAVGIAAMVILLSSIRYSPGAAVTWFLD